MNPKAIVAIILLMALSGVIGYTAGKLYDKNSADISALKNDNAKLSAQIEKIKAKFPPSPEMKFILGKVTSIHDRSLVLEVNQSQESGDQVDIFEDFPKTKTILVDSSTQIVKFQQKSEEELQNDIKKFKELSSKSNDTKDFLQSQFKEIQISLKDIPIGSILIVDGGKDVKELSTFTASKIMLQQY